MKNWVFENYLLGKILILTVVISILGCAKDSKEISAAKDEIPNLELNQLVTKWSKFFVTKVDSTYKATLNFYLSDSTEACHVLFSNNEFELIAGSTDAYNFSFSSTKDHYNKIFRGEMTAMTSMGQASASDAIPLNYAIKNPVSDNAINDFLSLYKTALVP